MKSFVVACKEYFGLKDGQKLLEFKQEVDALLPEEVASGPLVNQ